MGKMLLPPHHCGLAYISGLCGRRRNAAEGSSTVYFKLAFWTAFVARNAAMYGRVDGVRDYENKSKMMSIKVLKRVDQ